MIERHVYIKLNDEHCNTEARIDTAKQIVAGLSPIEAVESIVVGLPADETSLAAWDLSIRLSFADKDALASYTEDERYKAVAGGFVKDRTEVLKVWDFEPDSGKEG